MIGLDTLSGKVVDYLILGGLTIVGIGYLVGSWRKGHADATNAAFEIANSEVDILKDSRTRLEAEVATNRERISTLTGTVDQLRHENADLKKLVMLDRVPPALTKAFETTLIEIVTGVMDEVRAINAETRAETQQLIAAHDAHLGETREYYEALLAERFKPLEEGIAYLLRGDRPAPAKGP